MKSRVCIAIPMLLPVDFLVGMTADPYDSNDKADPWAPELWKLVLRSLEYLLVSGLKTEVILAFARKEILELVKKKGSVASKLKNIVLLNTSLDKVAAAL